MDILVAGYGGTGKKTLCDTINIVMMDNSAKSNTRRGCNKLSLLANINNDEDFPDKIEGYIPLITIANISDARKRIKSKYNIYNCYIYLFTPLITIFGLHYYLQNQIMSMITLSIIISLVGFLLFNCKDVLYIIEIITGEKHIPDYNDEIDSLQYYKEKYLKLAMRYRIPIINTSDISKSKMIFAAYEVLDYYNECVNNKKKFNEIDFSNYEHIQIIESDFSIN